MGHYTGVRGMFWWVTMLGSEVWSDGSLCWVRYMFWWVTMLESEVCSDGSLYLESEVCSDGSLCWDSVQCSDGSLFWDSVECSNGSLFWDSLQCSHGSLFWESDVCSNSHTHTLPLGHYFICWKFRHTKYTQIVWVKRSATAWIRIWTLWTLNPASYPHGLWCHLAHLHTVKVASICQVEATLWTSVDLDVSNSIGISGT